MPAPAQFSGAWRALVTRVSPCSIKNRATVYFIAAGGATAVNSQTGAVRWTVLPGGFDWGDAALAADGTLYVIENGDFLRQLNAITPDGTIKWRFSLPPDPSGIGPLLDRDGNVYVSSGGSYTLSFIAGRLVSLSPSGSVIWSYDQLRRVKEGGVLSADGTVYLSAMPTDGQEDGLIGFRGGKLVSKLPGGGSPFLDAFGRVFYMVGSEMRYFTSAGYDPNAWSEIGRTPERMARR